MAIANFKHKIFDDPKSLADWAATNATTIYAIVSDASGKYVLFYA